jgi:hypothetical protein
MPGPGPTPPGPGDAILAVTLDAAAMTRHPSRTLAERLAEIGRSCPKFAAQAASDLGLPIEVLPPEAD